MTADSPLLRVHDALDGVRTLGPATAAGIWTQGCLRGCRGCMSPDTFDPGGGSLATVAAVGTWLQSTGRRFLVLSGGEPMDQAEALVALIDLIREDRAWVVTCYTGHRLEDLVGSDDAHVHGLLGRLDLLIDGAYVEARHASLRWRGSSNQRVHNLTGRIALLADTSVGVDVHFDEDDRFRFIGVPPVPRFVETFVDLWPRADRADRSAVVVRPVLPFPVVEAP